MLGGLVRRSTQVATRRGYQAINEGWPGSNLPFNTSKFNTMAGRCVFTMKCCMYLAPPFWFPFFIVQYHLKKNNA